MTHPISGYLTIAGIAQRRAQELREEIAEDRHNFPNGDQPTCASELASCEVIISAVRILLSARLRLLDFKPNGRAIAQTPPSVWELVAEEERLLAEP